MYYFAYGSNLHLEQMRHRCPGCVPVAPYTLPGYRLVFRGVADIEKVDVGSVAGAIFKITPACLRALDAYEGYPTFYIRDYFYHPEFGQVMFYRMRDQTRVCPPSDYYLRIIAVGYKHWGLPIPRLADAADVRPRQLLGIRLNDAEKSHMFRTRTPRSA